MTMEDEITRNLLLESLSDYIQLWEIPHSLRETHGVKDEEERFARSLPIVEKLIKGGLVAGQFQRIASEDTADKKERLIWEAWRDLNPKYNDAKEVSERVAREWRALGREPMLGEIVYFRHSKNIPSPNVPNNPQGPK
jgi:hypothetical protein